jgi:integrase
VGFETDSRSRRSGRRHPDESGVCAARNDVVVPRDCAQPKRPVMTIDQVKKALEVLDLRERLVFKLGVLAGMRCSEIFGLRRGRVQDDYVEVVERVSRRDIDTPKTAKSRRKVALSSGVKQDLKLWLESRSEDRKIGCSLPRIQRCQWVPTL